MTMPRIALPVLAAAPLPTRRTAPRASQLPPPAARREASLRRIGGGAGRADRGPRRPQRPASTSASADGPASSSSASAARPSRNASRKARTVSRPARPSTPARRPRRSAHSANARSWSSRPMASRMPPRASRASQPSTIGSTLRPSSSAIRARRSRIADAEWRWKSNRWQRDTTVAGTLCASVVASTRIAWGRWLFERFQEGVPGRLGELMRLVQDIDAEARPRAQSGSCRAARGRRRCHDWTRHPARSGRWRERYLLKRRWRTIRTTRRPSAPNSSPP